MAGSKTVPRAKLRPRRSAADGAALQDGEIREVREAARALEGCRNRPDPRARLLDDAALVVGEPERLRAPRRTAPRGSVLVRQVLAFFDVGPVGEEVVGVQSVVPVKLPGAPAKSARPRLEGCVEHRSAGAAVLGAERARHDFDLVNGVDRRLDDIGHAAEEVDVARVVVDPVEQVVVLRGPHAVGGKHQRRARAGLGRHHSGAEAGEDRIVAAVDRQVFDRAALQGLADRTAAGLEQRRLSGHHDLFSQTACREREVDDRLLLDTDRDAFPHALLEALEFDFDRVGAGADGREDVGAVVARHRGQREGLTFVGDGDRGAGKHASRLVLHRAQNRPRVNLGTRRCAEQHRDHERPRKHSAE